MPRSLATLVRFKRDKTGMTAVEYGLIVALIASVIFASVSMLGGALNNKFTGLATQVGIANAAAK